MEHTRREFIQLMGLLAVGLQIPTLTSCGLGKKITDPYEALLLMREQIRGCADYLPARMAEVIATKDPEKMFVFVRDSIQTYPNMVDLRLSYERSSGVRSYNYRWGDTGCLRYGAGTFFEKAHLLQSMLAEAGFTATLKYGPFDIEKTGWDKVFFYPQKRAFDVHFPRSVDLSIFRTRPLEFAELDDDRLQQVLQHIQKSLPDDFQYPDPNWNAITGYMDVVELEWGEKSVYLNPNLRDAQFGELYLERVDGQSRQSSRGGNVQLRLKLINALEPYREINFIDAKFPLEKLFGNQLVIQFQSHLSTREQLTLPRNRNQTFTPVIGLAGPSLSDKDAKEFTFSGKAVHINGDTLEVKESQLLVNGVPVETGMSHPELRRQVTMLEAKAGSIAYPKVSVRFQAKDANDTTLKGLEGPDFELLEDGVPVPFQWHPQNQEGLKVLLLFDFSGSIPENFLDQGATDFAIALTEAVLEQTAAAKFGVATFTRPGPHKLELAPEWTDDLTVLKEQMEIIKGFSSEIYTSAIWHALANASQQSGADLIVFVTDGASGGDPNINRDRAIVQRGCPVITLGVGRFPNQECLQQMAYLTNGISRLVAEHQEAIDFILGFAEDQVAKPYLLSYVSTSNDKKEKELTLRVKDRLVSDTFRVVIPESSTIQLPAWIGIHLELDYEGQKVQRKLAGMPTHSNDPDRNPVLPIYREETEAAFFGNYTICFEGTEPTTAILLDELIEAKLSQKDVMHAIQNGTEEETLQALDAGFLTYPEDYLPFQHAFTPNSGKDFFCFQNGVRATLFSSYPNKEGTIVKALDILPFSQWRTIHHQPQKSFDHTLRHSLQLMRMEALNYETATLNLIQGQPLDYLTFDMAYNWMRALEDDALYTKWKSAIQDKREQVHLLPKDRQQDGFFNLDINSGTVFAQLMNNTGGGEQETLDRFAALDRALTVFDHVFKHLGVGPAVGAWIALEKKKMEYLMIATVAIITMDGQQAQEDLNKTLTKHLCNEFEGAAATMAGSVGDAYNDLVDYVSILTGKSISVCG
ncbi:MAG: VWA domain-containing protein [Saprospiraceae bacterium]|nr:VWA domain-containing protein [Saprospiraceae bacterium]